MSQKLVRVIHGYDAANSELRVTKILPRELELGELQRIFAMPSDDLMYDSFRVEPLHAAALEPYVGKLELDASVLWFLEAYTE